MSRVIDTSSTLIIFSKGETEKALSDFERVNELEPENKAAVNQITICKQKIKQYQQEEKARYKNMFSRFAAADGTVSKY